MATRYAVASGNWSAPGTWDGGATIPTTGDTVHANGFTVTIDQSINVDSLRNTSSASPVIAAGGGFSVTTGGYTITLANTTNALWPGSAINSPVLTVSNNSGTTTVVASTILNDSAANGNTNITMSGTGTLNVTGNLSVTANRVGVYGILISAAATLVLTGNVTNTGQGAIFVSSANCTLTVNGNLLTGTTAACVTLNATGSTITVNGNVTGGSANGINGILCNTGTATINVNGVAMGGIGSTSYAIAGASGVTFAITIVGMLQNSTANTATINLSGLSTISITGDCVLTGGSGPTIQLSASSSTITVVGNVIGGGCTLFSYSGAGAPVCTITGNVTSYSGTSPINLTANSTTLTINGAVTASTAGTAVESTVTTSTNKFTGPLIAAANGVQPYYGPTFQLIPTAGTYFRHRAPDGAAVDFLSSDAVPTYPNAADVRYGTSYGTSSTGTCRIPAAADVALGAAVDATTGLMTLDPALFWSYLVANCTTANSMGKRLAGSLTEAALAAMFPGV